MIMIMTMILKIMMKMLATLSCTTQLSSNSAHYGWLHSQQNHLMIMIMIDEDHD